MPKPHLLIAILLALACLSPAAPSPAAGETVCVFDHAFPPFSFVENGQPTGLEIDLINAAAKQAGVRLILRPLPWSQALGQVAVGHAQIITGLTPTPERRRLYLVLEPANAIVTSVVFARQDGDIKSSDDLRHRRVGVLRGSTEEAQLKTRKDVQVVPFDSESLALKALAEGRVEAAAGADLSVLHSIAQLGLKGITPLSPPLGSEPLHFALAQSQKALAGRLEEALKALRDSGEYERIRERWLKR